MIKVILIDDEPLARSIVKEYLIPHKDITIAAECNDGFSGIKAIQEHKPDLIFLDIQMPKINGFEMLELIEQRPSVIFTTAFDAYALKAFEQHAVDYLLKPFSEERFEQALQKWLVSHPISQVKERVEELMQSVTPKHQDEKHRIVVKDGSQILILPVQEVTHLEAYDDYVKIWNAKTFFLKKRTMNYYEDLLSPSQFLRVHRSFIINLSYLTRIEPLDKTNFVAVLKTGERVPLSRSGHVRLKTALQI
jgi:two-component system, LytTR family, response regulator